MKLDSLLTKNDNKRPFKEPLFLSSSIFNRLAEINAISIPEKKAEARRVDMIIILII